MNIRDVASPHIEGDRLKAIFERQHELMGKYIGIERTNGLLETEDIPVDLHDRHGQARLKSFAWRLTEELAEAVEVINDPFLSNPLHNDHFREEVADAFHFLVELCILSGVDASRVMLSNTGIGDGNVRDLLDILYLPRSRVKVVDMRWVKSAAGNIVWSLGQAMNCLKNKPWKQTHMLTDVSRFHMLVVNTFWEFFKFLKAADITADEITDLYFRKAEVNSFRQETHY